MISDVLRERRDDRVLERIAQKLVLRGIVGFHCPACGSRFSVVFVAQWGRDCTCGESTLEEVRK